MFVIVYCPNPERDEYRPYYPILFLKINLKEGAHLSKNLEETSKIKVPER